MKVGLHVNIKKTEIMAFNQTVVTTEVTSVNGNAIKQVDEHFNLGIG